MTSYFLALLPQLDLEFYHQVEQFYELGFFFDVRFPFHVTIHYFRELKNHDLNEIAAWMDHTARSFQGFTAEVQGVDNFHRMDGLEQKINVYYLKVLAPQFIQINNDLSEKFAPITNKEFIYTPHLSLIFPHNLVASPKTAARLNQSFAYLKQLPFTELALFASQDGAYSLIKKVRL